MRVRKYIVLMVVLLTAWIKPVLAQEDYLAIVCVGDTGSVYSVSGWEGSTFNWTVEGGEIAQNLGDSIVVDWGDRPGDYTLSVQEVSENGCAGEVQSGRVKVTAPEVRLMPDQYVCEGSLFTVEAEGSYQTIRWHDGSTGGFYTTGEEGFISATVMNEYGCVAEASMYLEVKTNPFVDLGPDTSLCGEQSLLLDGGYDAITYNWSTGDISREIMVYQGQQEIYVDVEDEYGCTNQDSIFIDNCDPSVYFADIQNAITPSNQDGRNDFWEIEEIQAFPNAVVDIYDRWGRLIWRSAPGYPEPWDGKNMRGNDVPMDSYHYIILLNFEGLDRVNGVITVIR